MGTWHLDIVDEEATIVMQKVPRAMSFLDVEIVGRWPCPY
jgi:hypothetical protein